MTELVVAHLVDVDWPVKLGGLCSEINLPVLMEPKEITLLRLRGLSVYNYTESLGMGDEYVKKDACTVYR